MNHLPKILALLVALSLFQYTSAEPLLPESEPAPQSQMNLSLPYVKQRDLKGATATKANLLPHHGKNTTPQIYLKLMDISMAKL